MAKANYERDIEETDEILDSSSGDPLNFWEEKQRDLLTSTVDYNLSTLSDLILSNTIDISPEYQRRLRWDEGKQSKLIESFLMNVPVPPIFLNEDTYGQYSVIDGKQRLHAIHEFIRGRLRLRGLQVFSDINGLTFDHLPPKLQVVLKTRPTLRAIIILRQSDEDIKFEVFQRLNTGGAHLNAQEIRNSAYIGPFNQVLLELSVEKKFHDLLKIKVKEKSAIYQEMRDVELVLRYFTFVNTWQDFAGNMRRSMDRYMFNNRKMTRENGEELRKDFLRTLSVVEACFGEHAFQRWTPERKQWRQQIVASLYDAEMFACRDLTVDKVLPKRHEIVEGLKGLFGDKDFRSAIDAQTNTPSYFRTRVVKMKDMLHQVLGE